LSAKESGLGDRKRKVGDIHVVLFAGIAGLVNTQVTARNRSFHRSSRGPPVAKKIGRSEWLVARLVVHVLAATGQDQRQEPRRVVGAMTQLPSPRADANALETSGFRWHRTWDP